MRIPREICILAAVAVIATGCASTAAVPHEDEPSIVRSDPQRTDAGTVQAEGVAYLGDGDRLADVRDRAFNNALERAVAHGSNTHLESRSRREFGVLVEDSTERSTAGAVTDVTTVDEGLDGMRYRVRIQARVAPEPAGLSSDPVNDWDATRRDRPAVVAPVQLASTASVQAAPHPIAPDPLSSLDSVADRGEVLTVCCHRFSESLAARVRPVLESAPNVFEVERLYGSGTALCYRLRHGRQRESMVGWLRQHLRRAGYTEFRVVAGSSPATLDLVFDGGFD